MMFDQDPYVTGYPEIRSFWEATEQGRMVLPQCSACGRFHWFPRAHCPFCHRGDIQWVPASGFGTLYSYSVTRGVQGPHVLAYVELPEGVVMLTNVVGCDPDLLTIGMPLRVDFRRAGHGRNVPVFQVVVT